MTHNSSFRSMKCPGVLLPAPPPFPPTPQIDASPSQVAFSIILLVPILMGIGSHWKVKFLTQRPHAWTLLPGTG